MALLYAAGTQQWLSSDAATTVYTISGLAFAPKALRFRWMGLGSATDLASSTTDSRRGEGYAVSTSSRACAVTQDQDATANAVCTTAIASDCCVATVTSTPAFDGKLDIHAFTEDGFQLIVDDAAPVDISVFWEAWGGSDITDASIGSFDEPPPSAGVVAYSTGAGSISGASFRPSVVFFAGTQNSEIDIPSRTDSQLCMGVLTYSASGGSSNIVLTGMNDDNSPTMDSFGHGSNLYCLAMIPQGGNTALDLRAEGDTTPFTSTQFRLNWLERSNKSRKFIFMCIGGGGWRAGELTLDTNTLNATTTVSGLPFVPVGLSTISRYTGQVETGADVAVAADRMTFGCASSTSSRRSMAMESDNGTADAAILLRIDYDQLETAIASDVVTVDVDAFTTDGFRLITDATNGTNGNAAHWIGYLTFGSNLSIKYKQFPFDNTLLRM